MEGFPGAWEDLTEAFFMKLFSTPPVLSGKKNKKRKKLLKAQRKA